jgi:hypothetical protein
MSHGRMTYYGTVLAFVLGLMAGVGIACFPQQGCEGCINEHGVCLRGIEDQACGSFGQSCMACAPTHSCQEGACEPVTVPEDPDAGPVDAGPVDPGPWDAGAADAGMPDEEPVDAGSPGLFRIMPSPTQVDLRGVAAATATEAYAVGGIGTLLRWDGDAWSAVSSPTTEDLDAVTLAEGSGWAVGAGGTFLSLSGGTWSVYSPSPTGGPLTGVSAASARSAMAVGKEGDQCYTFVWNGTEWAKFAVGDPHPYVRQAHVFMPSANTAFAVQSSMIMRWTGTSWEQLTVPTTSQMEGVWAPSGTTAYAVGSSGVVMKWTAPGSRTMEQRPPYTWFQAIWGSSATDIWAVGWGGTILHSNGNGWIQVPSPTTEHLYGVWGTGPDDVWIVGARGTILHGPVRPPRAP